MRCSLVRKNYEVGPMFEMHSGLWHHAGAVCWLTGRAADVVDHQRYHLTKPPDWSYVNKCGNCFFFYVLTTVYMVYIDIHTFGQLSDVKWYHSKLVGEENNLASFRIVLLKLFHHTHHQYVPSNRENSITKP